MLTPAPSPLDRLHRAYSGPIPARLRAAAIAGGATAHARAEAQGRARSFAALAADTRRAIARLRMARGPGRAAAPARLDRLGVRLGAYRNAAVIWRALAG